MELLPPPAVVVVVVVVVVVLVEDVVVGGDCALEGSFPTRFGVRFGGGSGAVRSQ